MRNKITFAVDNIDIIEENPDSKFAIVSMDFFASGKNLHDLYVSEETLMKTSESIKNCPVVFHYNEKTDDIGSHSPFEVPAGFVPETSEIKSKILPDGRTMLSTVAYIWKRYTGELISIFKRDGGEKPVSVEMRVFKTKQLPNEKIELLDFRYEAITLLGSLVTPAIPMASAKVLSFSELEEEYMMDLKKEFPTNYIDLGTSEIVNLYYTKSEEVQTEEEILGTTPEKEEHVMNKNKKEIIVETEEVLNVENAIETVEPEVTGEVETENLEFEKDEDKAEDKDEKEEVEDREDEKEDEEEDEKDKFESHSESETIAEMSAKIEELTSELEKMSTESQSQLSELESLRKFKSEVEESQKSFAVEKVIRELEEKVVIPEDAKAEMIADADNYSFSEIEKWETVCKAKSFDFAVRESNKSDFEVKKAGLPFGETTANSNGLWK